MLVFLIGCPRAAERAQIDLIRRSAFAAVANVADEVLSSQALSALVTRVRFFGEVLSVVLEELLHADPASTNTDDEISVLHFGKHFLVVEQVLPWLV